MLLPALCRFQLLVCKVKAGGGGLQWGLTRKSVLPELTQRYKKKKVTYKKKKCQSLKRYSPFHQERVGQTVVIN